MNEQLAINEHIPVIARHYNYKHFTYPWHYHSVYEIIYVREGYGERFVADSIEPFTAGDLILLGSNLPHYMKSDDIYYQNNPNVRVKGVVIQFAQDYMGHTINHYTDCLTIKQLLDESKRGIHFPYKQNQEIIRLIEELPQQNGINLITGTLLLLDSMASSESRRLLASPNYDESDASRFDYRIEKVLSFLNHHYREDLSLDTIASEISMNTSAFCRYFKKKTSKSCIQYIQDLRIGHACRLLSETSYDIFQVSIECGFNTVCHFNKIFKRKTGLSPTDYRKKISK